MQIYKIFMNPPNNYTNNYIHQTKIVGLQPQNIIKILKIFEIFEIVEIIIYLKNSKKNILYLCEDGILPNNPTRLLPIGDPPPVGFRFSPIARDFTH